MSYGETGVVGVLKRGSGPNIGMRANIDALPIKEESNSEPRSQAPRVMHARGHDGQSLDDNDNIHCSATQQRI